jgi:hypothetical protein
MKIISHGARKRRAHAYPIPEEESQQPSKKALLVGIAYTSRAGEHSEHELVGPYKDVQIMKALLICMPVYTSAALLTDLCS